MIKEELIEINITNRNKKYYENLKYFISGNTLQIKTQDLPNNSHIFVDVICDKCGKEYKLMYAKYFQNISNCGFFTCKKCSYEKKKMTNFERYGVDNYAKLENYGELVKEIKKDKYGDENYNNSEKYKETCLEKYGVKSYLQIGDKEKLNFKKRLLSIKKKLVDKHKNFGVYDIDDNNNYLIKCDKGHDFKIDNMTFNNRKNTIMCTICNPIGSTSQSGQEIQLQRFIQDNYHGEILFNNKFFGKEIDIYLPELKIGFEFNGIWWHNELYKNTNSHLEKTELCEENGIKLIHIYQDDWIYKQEIIKSGIINLLGKSKKIFARKCIIKEIEDNKLVKDFLEKNHLQGFVGSKIKIGLFYNEEIVSLMTFGSYRKTTGQKSVENSYEMLRFCNKLNSNIIGGDLILFKYFIEKHSPNNVIYCVDRSWGQGTYEKLGFKLVGKTNPNYCYIINGIRKHRFNFVVIYLFREVKYKLNITLIEIKSRINAKY